MSRRRDVSVGVKLDGDAKGYKSASEDAKKATESLRKGADKSSKGISSSFKNITKAMGPIVLAIGAIVGAFKTLKSILTGSIEGQEKLASVMGYLGGIMDGLKDIVIDFSNRIFKAFEDPKQAVTDLWETIKNFFVTPFKGMVDMVVAGWQVISQGAKGVGLAIAGIFDKEKREASRLAFDEMKQGMNDFADAAKRSVEPFINVGKAIGNIGKQLGERAKENQALALREIKLRQRIADESVKQAKIEAEISRLRKIANDDQENLLDQIEAQEQAMKKVEEKFQIQEAQAKEALAIQKERMALGHNSIEDVEKLRQLESDLVNLQAQRDDTTRTLLRRYGTLVNQVEALAEAERKAIEQARKAREDILKNIEESYMTELKLNDRRMEEMLASHQWTEEEKLRITQYFADKRNAILEQEARAAEQAAFDIREAFTGALTDISQGFNQMAMSGRVSTQEVIKQAIASITALIIKSIWASGLPLMAKIGMSAGASLLAGGITAQIPSFSKPGIVKQEMIARVADYPGVKRNPEIISPLSDLKKMMGGTRMKLDVEVHGKAAGRDLALVLNRYVMEEQLST